MSSGKKAFLLASAIFDLAWLIFSIVATVVPFNEGKSNDISVVVFCWVFLIIVVAVELVVFLSWKKIIEWNEKAKHNKEMQQAKKQQQANRKIVKTLIIDTSTQKSLAGAIARDYIFGFAGVVTQKGKQVFTFLVVYDDGSRQTENCVYDTPRFNELINYLDV